MSFLPDDVVRHLAEVTAQPDLSGTKYQLLRPIGRGGMGEVFLAEDRDLRRPVALKVLDSTAPAELAERLRREAQVLARLEHPGVVPVHDVGTLADGRAYYAMKYVRGERLDAWLRTGHSLPTVLRLFERICDAVAFAHAQGIVHRDLKPQNIMVGEFGEALVLDWGLARVLRGLPEHWPPAPGTTAPVDPFAETLPPTGERTIEGAVLGTPGYMAPEQARGEGADARSDVFSLGVVLYAALNGGVAPFGGQTLKDVLLATRSAEPRPLPAQVPPPLASIARRALAKDPARRYASARELGADVTAWLDGGVVSAHRETLRERLGRWYRKYQLLLWLVGAYLLMRLVVAAVTER